MATVSDHSAAILESLSEGIVAFDKHRQVVMANAYLLNLLGRQDARVQGLTPEALFGDHPEILRILSDGFVHRKLTPHTDLVHHNASGSLQHLRVSSSFLNANEQSGMVLVMRDVSELKRMERGMFQVEKMTALGRLAASVAHEVRNPLGAIDIQLQLLAEDLGDLDPARGEGVSKRLTIAQAEMKRIDRIVHHFLRFSRTPRLHLRQLVLNDVVRHVFELVSPDARERDIQLQLELDAQLPEIDGDEDQLAQAVLNITVNAFQSMDGGGRLLARTWFEEDPRQVCLMLSDTGCGIDEAGIDRIFEFYYTTKDEGTGLGLSIAQRILYQHGGHIDVESHPGKGTAFRIGLPVAGSSSAENRQILDFP